MSEPMTLHPSHRWGQRPTYVRTEPGSNRYREVKIPCCLNCLVDGYEDVWDAFEPCRRVDNPITTHAPCVGHEGGAE